ncbi:glycerate kinase [Pelagicoccus sp. SDUM812003]|uniref:glycerate kinase family protein n=1 Tax=Pelagicoccus sp. SDUM812003 TaxID=3041267 RepID=UPI00280DD238|nr:glycerate kinase [Pelagicoccus sp. SDUM812003]MDQ8201699.1 glycerate kinase [Pelagicoccus sp. SDUM812003]
MRNVLIAFDKFKDALTAVEACQTAAVALHDVQPDWQVSVAPIADGGDGFCHTLTSVAEGQFFHTSVHGPQGAETTATFGMVDTGDIDPAARLLLDFSPNAKRLAIIEFAQSSGIALVPPEERSPWTSTSYGLGQTIQAALEQGADSLLIGLGGSATHDLALGALQALGFTFFTRHGEPIDSYPTPDKWDEIGIIEPPDDLPKVELRIACDVENPLLGESGAASVFGPQKGLQPGDLGLLESETARIAIILCHACDAGIQTMDTPGAGAAGGAAFGLMNALDGRLVPGAELVFAWAGLGDKLAAADLVITGEGRFDASSLQGKGPGELAIKVLKQKKELRILAGSVGEIENEAIAKATLAITPPGTSLSEAIPATAKNLKRCIAQLFSERSAATSSILHESSTAPLRSSGSSSKRKL